MASSFRKKPGAHQQYPFYSPISLRLPWSPPGQSPLLHTSQKQGQVAVAFYGWLESPTIFQKFICARAYTVFYLEREQPNIPLTIHRQKQYQSLCLPQVTLRAHLVTVSAVVRACNRSTWEVEAGGSEVQGLLCEFEVSLGWLTVGRMGGRNLIFKKLGGVLPASSPSSRRQRQAVLLSSRPTWCTE